MVQILIHLLHLVVQMLLQWQQYLHQSSLNNKDLTGQKFNIAGDLTVSGDDITMGTNTAGNLLIADGTNFNSVAVGSLSEISTVANDDVFLAVDTSGGGLKKIARSALLYQD